MKRLEENGEPPFDLHRTVVKYIGVAALTFFGDYAVGRFTGHPKRLSVLFLVAMVFVVVSCVLDRFARPWLAARRKEDEDRRAEAERWRMN